MVDVDSIRTDVYDAIRTILVANKPSYTYSGTTYEYDVVAEYVFQLSEFPYIVLNPALVEVALIDIDGSGEDYTVNIQLDLYALGSHHKKVIDEAVDSVRSTIINNQSDLKDTYGLLLMQDPFDESETSPFEDNSQTVNTASMIIKMKLQ